MLYPSVWHDTLTWTCFSALDHWGRVTHICVGNLTIIGQDNGLSPGRRQAIIWTSAGILLIGPWGTNFSEILISIQAFSFKKMHLKMSSAKWRPFCLGLNVLMTLWGTSLWPTDPPHQNPVISELWCFLCFKPGPVVEKLFGGLILPHYRWQNSRIYCIDQKSVLFSQTRKRQHMYLIFFRYVVCR